MSLVSILIELIKCLFKFVIASAKTSLCLKLASFQKAYCPRNTYADAWNYLSLHRIFLHAVISPLGKLKSLKLQLCLLSNLNVAFCPFMTYAKA